MKKISITLVILVAVLLVGCNNSKSKQDASATATITCPALASLGIDVDKVAPLAGKIDCNDDARLTPLSDHAIGVLLDPVYHFGDNPPEGSFRLAGACALNDGYTLLLFHYEGGECTAHALATYDSDGKMADYVDLGVWDGTLFDEDEGMDPHHPRVFVTKAYLDADRDKQEFKLVRDYSLCDLDTTNAEYKPGTRHWNLHKEYTYSVLANGLLRQVRASESKDGNIDDEDLMIEEITDLGYMPASDATRLDKLSELLQRSNVQQAMSDPESTVKLVMQNFMQEAFEQNSALLLNWLANHRDNKPMSDLLKAVFSDSWLPKDRLTEELNHLPPGDARTWLENLTAQWGPKDAVG